MEKPDSTSANDIKQYANSLLTEFTNQISAHSILPRAGNMDEATRILDDLLHLEEHGERAEVAIAGAYMDLGNYDKAMEWLEKAYRDRVGYLLAINSDPFYAWLRPDPRFQALLKKIGFPDAN